MQVSLKVWLSIGFMLFYVYGFGKTINIDSLRNLLNTTEGVKQIKVYNKLANVYFRRNLDSTDYFNQKAIHLAQKNIAKKGYKKVLRDAKAIQVKVNSNRHAFGKADSLANLLLPVCLAANDTTNLLLLYNQKYVINYLSQKHDSTLYFLQQGLRFSSNNLKAKAQIYGNMAIVYREQNNIPKAIKLFFQSLEAYKELENKYGESLVYSNIGVTYVDQYQFEKAIKYLKKGITISKEIENLAALTWLYGILGECYKELEKYDNALTNYKKALALAEEIQDIPSVFYQKSMIANHYLQYSLTDSTYQLALQLTDEIERMDVNIENVSNYYYYINKAIIYNIAGSTSLAIEYAEKAYQSVKEGNNTSSMILATKQLAFFHQKIGKYKKAYEYLSIFKTLSDSLGNDRNLAAIEIQEAEHQFEVDKTKQEQQLKVAKTALRFRAIIIIASLLILVLVTVIAVILRRANRLKTEQNETLEHKVKERSEALLLVNQELEEAKIRQQLEDAKSRFFANVSHEFRTPLTLIQAPLNSALSSNELNNKNFTRISRALLNVAQLNTLVSQILDLTKLDSDKLVLKENTIVLYLLVRRTVAMFESLVQQKDIKLILEYDLNKELQVEIDEEKFVRILTNYLSNAIKFTPESGQVTIKVTEINNNIRLSVNDTGIGIKAELLNKVFERYYQISHEKDDAPLGEVNHYMGGTGIGLSLCKEYAALFGGRTWAESEVAKGSIFYFEFPKKEIFTALSSNDLIAIDNVSKPLVVTSNIENTIKSDKSTTILVVEDNVDLRHFLAEILETEHNIVLKANGKAALDWLTETNKKPELIISDVMMPLMNGFELLENLKSSDAYRHIPVMMLTARADVKDKLKALRIGVDDYLLKPFNETELKIRINNIIQNAANRQFLATTEENTITSEITFVSETDHIWLKELETQVEKHLNSFDLHAAFIANLLFISRSQLFLKTKRLTGLTFNQYLKEARLQKAKYLIENGSVLSSKEVAYSVGFKHPNYFSKQYEKRFGKRPSEYF